MTNRKWLSVTEIAQLWSDTTGGNAEAFERDLDTWFSEFVTREPSPQSAPTDGDGNTTNRLMGLLGGRYLQRETFGIFCEERGYDMPHFWSSDDAEDEGPDEPLPDPRYAASDFAPGRAASDEPAAMGESAGMATGSWPDPNVARRSTAAAAEAARPLIPATGGLSGRKAIRLTGALVLGLSLLAVGFVLGQGGTEDPKTDASVAGQDQLTTPLVVSLRSELEGAQRKIANLSTALQASEQEAEQLYADLLVAQQALDMEPDAGQLDTEAASLDINSNGCGISEPTLYVQADHVNVREGPGTSYGVKLQVNKGRSLVKLDRRGEWLWMTYDVGETTTDGWIHSSFVSTECL